MSEQRKTICVKAIDIENNRIRHLRSDEKERIERFFVSKLNERGLLSCMDYATFKHYLREHIFEGWWESYEAARRAVERLVNDLASDKAIPEVVWVVER
jgi:hypothetical protein